MSASSSPAADSSAVAPDAPSLPLLPERMVGRPYGVDESGRSIVHTKGNIIRGAVEYMLECVERRAGESLPLETGVAEREALRAQARAEAMGQLVARLNAAILDPAYHVTAEYLLDDSHGYSLEFDAFLCEICRQMSGDPRYHFNRASKTIPASLSYLARPFSISQVYGLLPRLVSRFVDSDLRVVRTGRGSAVIRMYLDRERKQLTEALWQVYLLSACRHGQGALAQIPRIHSGLPVAATQDLRCMMKGDPYCEWEFTWLEPPRQGARQPSPQVSAAAGAAQPTLVPLARAVQAPMGAPLAAPLGPGRPARSTGLDSLDMGQLPLEPALPLPPLPEQMAGRPFGADENGRPIAHVKGNVIHGTIEFTLDCVGQRVVTSLPPDTSAEERKARLVQARQEALGQLVTRLNVAIPDRHYHVTAEYLLDEHHSYSMEFSVFLDGICRELSGDPRYEFNSGARAFPASMTYLVRPFSVSQGYGLVPRITALFQDTDVRVVHTGPGSAILQWHAEKDLAQVTEGLKPRVVWNTCQGLQGVFSQIPRILAGLPPAEVRELRCILKGDPCCEWAFTWQEPTRRRLRLPWRREDRETRGRGDAERGKIGVSSPARPAVDAPLATPPSLDEPPQVEPELPPLPEHMIGRPFGADERGRPITHSKGDVIRTAVQYMLECVERRTDAGLPAETGADARETRIAEARAEALEQLVTRLNAAILDPVYHITAEYLQDVHHSYSIEFDIYHCEICRQLSGDPDFHFHRGGRTIPPSMAFLVRPFTVSQAFGLVPRLVGKFADVDLRVVRTVPGSAVIQWHEGPELQALPAYLRQHYIASSCPTSRGALVQLPKITAGLPPAEVREIRCLLRGDPYCEWEFTWQEPARRGLRLPWHRSAQDKVPQGQPSPSQAVPQPAPQPLAAAEVREPVRAGGLPALPERMVGHPFGADEQGHPISQAKGHLIRSGVEYMLECVEKHTADSLPLDIGIPERKRRIEQARAEALNQLVTRLNATIPDPAYHVTAEYLLDERHSYSLEFIAFLQLICYELSADPRYYYQCGARMIPPSMSYLFRPLSVGQAYSLLPRLASRFAAADLRVVQVGVGLAIIRSHQPEEVGLLPENLRSVVLWGGCQAMQGAFARLPGIIAGLPEAKIRETACMTKGDPYCEWEFTWQEAGRRGLYRLWPWATQDKGVQKALQAQGLPNSSLSVPLGPADMHPTVAGSGAMEERMGQPPAGTTPLGEATSAASSQSEEELPPLPTFMQVRPYGADESGKPIRQANGASIVGVIAQMQDYAGEQAMRSLPTRASEAERQAAAAGSCREALDRLVARLNAAIPDPSYRVTREYLLNPEHYYSHEFNLYANEFACEICGDPQFYYHRGLRSIPGSMIHVARPLSLPQIYRLLPSLVAKVTQTDVRTVLAADQSAILQWHPGRQFENIPTAIHRHYMRMACRAYQGAYASIPQIHSGLQPARIRELHCLLHGDPYCEWEFTWVAPKPHFGLEVWGGVAFTILLVAALALRQTLMPWLAVLGIVLPITVALMSWRLKRVAYDRDQQRRLLLDQRESAEQHYDELQQASANLQLSNVALQHRLSELTALHEIGLNTGATLDLDQLLDSSLQAVTAHLGFDRALILLVDEERRLLVGGHSAGGTPELAEVVREMAISLDNDESFLAEAVHLGQPVVVADATQATDEETLGYVRALQARTFVAVPLLVHGGALGVMAVDNAITNRPLSEDSHELLMTVGSQIAGAIDRVRLYQTLEQRVAQRTSELATTNERMQLEIQERVRAEETIRQTADTLRESERRLAYIIDFWPDPAFVLDADGRVTSWNRAIEEMTGVSAQDMLGRGDYAYAVPFYGEPRPILIDLVGLPDQEIESRYSQLKREGGVLTGEAHVPALRGKGAYLYAMAAALHDSQGRPVGAIETIRDVTARREAEEAVKRSEAHFRLLANVGQALSSTLDMPSLFRVMYAQISSVMYAEHMIIALHDEAAHEAEFAYSRDPDEVDVGSRCPAESGMMGYIIQNRRAVFLHGDVAEQARRLGVAPVEPIPVAWLGVPMIIGERVLGVIVVQHYTDPAAYDETHCDLLEAVASQAAIALENARLYHEAQRERLHFESVVLNSPSAIVTIDLQAHILSWNPAAESLFGYTQEEAIGRYIGDLVARTETMQAQAATHTQQAARGEMIHEITQRLRRDGSVMDVELLAVPLVIQGVQNSTLVMYHDITELQRARQEAEVANQAKSSFLATMSHEIRTPMNAVIGMTGLLLDTQLTAEQREFAETIRTSGDSLLTIINDILDFSKIEAGRMDLESQPFDLRECVESAVDLLAARAAEKGLNLASLVDMQVPSTIVGDVTRLRQILVNLLGNAVKFTEKGEVVLSVQREGQGQLAAAPSDLASIHFSVRDTGIGIPPERMDRLFRSFSQVDASTTRRFGGTGLGLAISKRLCELMGGAMWVESKGVPGEGSTFHFTIRAEAAPALAQRARLHGLQPRLAGKRALIVDDNPTNRRIVTLQTQSWGMIPHDTGLPAEALAWVRRGDPFDVAFLDRQMPEMDGITLARKMRELRDESTLPIVMLSSWGQREVETEEAPYFAFLMKPLKASQIYDVLVSLFGTEEEIAELERGPSGGQFDAQMAERHPLRILLAEDNAINQKLALRLLGRMGYRADVAGNGVEVLRSLHRQPYDVVLMDVQMPDMDGLEATRAIWREWPAEERPRIVAMTANAMKEDRDECLAAGMDDYISKPIHVDELVRALQTAQPLLGAACVLPSTPQPEQPVPSVLASLTPQAVAPTSEVVSARQAAAGPGEPASEDIQAREAPAAQPSVLDRAALDKLLDIGGGDQAFLAEMIDTFLADAPGMLAQMQQSVERGDAALLRRSAHSLKSNSRDLGAMTLSQVCLELETMGKENHLEGAADKLAVAEAEYARVAEALQALRQG